MINHNLGNFNFSCSGAVAIALFFSFLNKLSDSNPTATKVAIIKLPNFIFLIFFLIFSGCANDNNYTEINNAIIKKDYEKALNITTRYLLKEKNNMYLNYKKAEILNYMSNIDFFKIECFTLVMKYGHYLKYFKQKRADRKKINKKYTDEAKKIYLLLIQNNYVVQEEGRDKRYFNNTIGWIYLAENDLLSAEKYFNASKEKSDLWDAKKALEYLKAEK